jgi:hypothetical protein
MVAHTLLIARLAYLIDYSNIAVQDNAETSTAELSTSMSTYRACCLMLKES